MHKTLIDSLRYWAKEIPQKRFLQEDSKCWSFAKFYEDVAKASAFLKRQGVKKGDFIVLHVEQKSVHLLAYMALLNIGAVSVHLYPEREDEYVLFAARHCKAKYVISSTFSMSEEGVQIISKLDYETYTPLYESDMSELAYVMFTSGTTSAPKAVQITHESLLFVTKTLINLAGMREQKEKEIIFMPLGSTGGLGHFHACLFLANSIRLFPGFYAKLQDEDIELLCDTIKKESITGILLTPALVLRLLLNHKQKLQMSGKSLRYILANVTPMRRETILELLQTLANVRFCTYYGSTEASRSIVNVCRQNKGYEHFTGKPAEGVQIKLVGENENKGEVYIKGKNVMLGYMYRGSDGFNEGWFQSGDLARRDESGFIQVLGRVKEMINIDGLKVLPNEVESVVFSHKKVQDAGVCALKDDLTYQRIGLAVVSDVEDKAALAEEISGLFKKRYSSKLDRYKIPKQLYFASKIPRTDLGKVKREALAKILQNNIHVYTISEEK
jgi:acyl-CoA synthetase (AMP-forming)/AMP-acid ligase II